MATFEEIAPILDERIKAMVWCNMATVDRLNRPRSRVVQPLWEGAMAWIVSRRDGFKAQHIAVNPAISLAYTGDNAGPVYADGTVSWADELETRRRVWKYALALPEPLRYDLTPLYQTPENPVFGVLRFTPTRIDVPSGWSRLVWRA